MSKPAEIEQEAVRQAILDYVEGVYEADPTRIERSVHPDLAKRGFFVSNEKWMIVHVLWQTHPENEEQSETRKIRSCHDLHTIEGTVIDAHTLHFAPATYYAIYYIFETTSDISRDLGYLSESISSFY